MSNLAKLRVPTSTQTAADWCVDNKLSFNCTDYRQVCNALGVHCHATQSGKVALTQAIVRARKGVPANSVAVETSSETSSSSSHTHMSTHTNVAATAQGAVPANEQAVTAATLMQQAITLLGVAGSPSTELSAEQIEQVCELIQIHAPKPTAKEIVVRRLDESSHHVGATHEAFAEVLEWVSLKEHVYIHGPAGTGKSHIGKQVAEALGRPFAAMSFSSQSLKSELFGMMSPITGEYIPTEFFRMYSEGGIFMLDEADNANPNLLCSLNMCLANDTAAFPCGMVEKHPDFICIATANTFGNGATEAYVGRNPLDASAKNRLVCIFAGYDRTLEAARFSKQACEMVWAERDRLSGKNGWIMSMRDIQRVEKLFGLGYDASVVYKRAIEANIPQNLRK